MPGSAINPIAVGGGSFSGAASDVTNVPAGDISATDVQDALNQLDTNKVDSGDVLTPDGATLEQSGTDLRLRRPVTTYVELAEIGDPGAPADGQARLYVRSAGGGKTELVVVFPSGAVQVIKTEP